MLRGAMLLYRQQISTGTSWIASFWLATAALLCPAQPLGQVTPGKSLVLSNSLTSVPAGEASVSIAMSPARQPWRRF